MSPVERDEKPSRLPILFSAVVCPGAGQCMQGRKIIGPVYMVVFLACVVFLFITIFSPLFVNLRALGHISAVDDKAAFSPIPWRNILSWFVLCLLVYLINLLDVYLGYRRRVNKWRGRKYENI
jgi:hypothetical protein